VLQTVTEILLSIVLTTSIAGAGLIIAIYALIAPISNRIFEERLNSLHNKMVEFEKSKEKITPEESLEEFQHFRAKAVEIQSMKAFPSYLASGVKFVFTCYIMAAFFSLLWLTNVVQNTLAEFLLISLFCLSTISFFIVGWYAIKDVNISMKEEFEQLKKAQEEMEKTRKKIEEFRKKIEEAKSKK